MKKILITLAIVGLLISFSPVVKADVQPSQQELNQRLSVVQQILAILQQIRILQAQLDSMLAQGLTVDNTPTAVGSSPVEFTKIEPTQVSFENMDDFIFVSRFETSNSMSLYANNIHNGDTITFTINTKTTTKTFEDVEGIYTSKYKNIGSKKTYGGYDFPVINELQPNTEYPYTVRLDRGNNYAIKNGVFKTLSY